MGQQLFYRLHYLLRIYIYRLILHFVHLPVELTQGAFYLLLKLLLVDLQNLILALELGKL